MTRQNGGHFIVRTFTKFLDKRCVSAKFCITRNEVVSIGPWSNGAVEQRPGHDHQQSEGAAGATLRGWLGRPAPHQAGGMISWDYGPFILWKCTENLCY